VSGERRKQQQQQETQTWANLNPEHDKNLDGSLPDSWVGIFEHCFQEANEVAGLDGSNTKVWNGGLRPLQDFSQHFWILLLQQNRAHYNEWEIEKKTIEKRFQPRVSQKSYAEKAQTGVPISLRRL